MAESHVVSALVKKRSELAGEIEHYEKIIKECRENLTSIDKTIHIFDDSIDLRNIKSRKVIKKGYFSNGEATKLILDILRTSANPIKTSDLVDILADKKSLSFSNNKERYSFSKNVSVALNNIWKRGLIEQIAKESGTAIWDIAKIT